VLNILVRWYSVSIKLNVYRYYLLLASLVRLVLRRRPGATECCAEALPTSRVPGRHDAASVEDLFHSADDKLFCKILHNSAHVLQPPIPDRQPSSYDLRPRSHDKLLLNKTTYLNERDFVIRMLYRDSYWCVYLCKLGLCQICYTWLLTLCFISCVCQLFLKNKMNE